MYTHTEYCEKAVVWISHGRNMEAASTGVAATVAQSPFTHMRPVSQGADSWPPAEKGS